MKYISRTIERCIQRAATQFPVLLVTGPRQIGKTTVLKHLANSDRTYITFDDPLLVAATKSDPRLFLERHKPPLLLDEIHTFPSCCRILRYMSIRTDLLVRFG